MCLSPISSNYIAVGSSDSHIRIYDRRYLSLIDLTLPGSPIDKQTVPVKIFKIPSQEKRPFRVTSINYSSDECELLVSYSSDHLYLFDITKDGLDCHQTNVKIKKTKAMNNSKEDSPPPVRRLRLRGDWSDTGPAARPERELTQRVTLGQARPQLQATIMHRMTEVLSRMLADPRTRIGLSTHANEIAHANDVALANAVEEIETFAEEAATNADRNTNYIVVPVESTPPVAGPSNTVPSNLERCPTKIPTKKSTDFDDSDEDIADEKNAFDEANAVLDEANKKFDYMKMKFVGHRNAR